MRSLVVGFWLASLGTAAGTIVTDVRAAIAQRNFTMAENALAAYRAREGVTPEGVEALSWMARGALATRSFDQADRYAAETRKQAMDLLKNRPLDREPRLPLALGASIEVHAQVMMARGERDQAVTFLRQEFARFRQTSMAARIQKNIHLISLEGKPAPPLEVQQWLGARPAPLAGLKGRPVLVFFWAHWCGDCKNEVPILAQLMEHFGPRGLALVAPTKRYGYVRGGEEASPEQELRYIEEVRRQYYAPLGNMTVPIGAANFEQWGSSTTPTLVLLDRNGVVRYYHPGNASYQELAARVDLLFGS